MKITLLQVDHFRKHTHSILELEPFNVIRGDNHSGKSSISQAISMVMTPSTMGLDETGRGFATKIQRGSEWAAITADIQGKVHLVRRTVTLKTNTTGRTDKSICLDDPEWHPSPFERQLDGNKRALSVALNTDRFFTWDEKEQKSLLAKLALPKQYDFDEETMDAVDKILGEETIDFASEPFAVIEKAYKLLYKERESVNRQVKDFVVPEPLAAVAVDTATLQSQLEAAREKQRNLIKERDAATAGNADTGAKIARLNEKIYQLDEQIHTAHARVEALIGFLSESRLKDLQKVADGAAALKELEEERVKVQSKLERRKERLALYTKMTGVGDGECPTCYRPTDGNFVEEATTQAKADLEKTQKEYVEIYDKMKSLGDVAGAVKAIEGHKTAGKQKEEIDGVIGVKTNLLKDARAELDKLPKVTDVLLPFTKPLDEVDAEITTVLAKLQPAAAADARRGEIEIKTTQLAAIQKKAANVDTLVKYFDKDGVKAKLLKEHVGGFVDKMNVVMAAFGYKVDLDIEPDFLFVVTDEDSTLTPVKELSDSEKLMFAVALQCAVSKAAGIGIVIADRMDTFLPEHRSKANQVLYKLVSEGVLEQVVIIVSDLSEAVPKLPNSAFFFVESGSVRRLTTEYLKQ